MSLATPNPNLSLRLSPRGASLIKSFERGPKGNVAHEGYAPFPYRDDAGWLTVGWGHKIRKRDRFDYPLTLDSAQSIFDADVDPAEIYVRAACAPTRLTQYEFDALVMFAFNLGLRAFENSTLRRLVKTGDMRGAAAQFQRWNKITVKAPDGRDALVVADGLVIRRHVERMLFEGADDGAIAIARADLSARAAAGSLA